MKLFVRTYGLDGMTVRVKVSDGRNFYHKQIPRHIVKRSGRLLKDQCVFKNKETLERAIAVICRLCNLELE